MKHWARIALGILLGSVLTAGGTGTLHGQQQVVEGPWLNGPAPAGTSGWRAKRSPTGAVAAQATVAWPPGSPSSQGRASAGNPGLGSWSREASGRPPAFWGPAKAAGSSSVRVAQQPVGPASPPPKAQPPATSPTPPKPAPSRAPEAPALLNGQPPGAPAPQPASPEVIPPGQPTPLGPEPSQEIPLPYPGNGQMEGVDWQQCEDGACEACFAPWWAPGGYWGYPLFYGLFRDLTLFGGAHAFRGPIDGGVNANFGLHEGVNYSGPLGDPWGGGFQIGFQAAHSNFRGYARRIYDGSVAGQPVLEPALDPPSDGALAEHSFITPNGDRDQLFFTAGLFRRAPMGGLQWGVVFDLMHDAYYYTADLKQIRAELSLVCPGWRELGFWGAFGVGNERVTDQFTYRRQDNQQQATYQLDFTLEPTDQFNFFYRQYFANGGEGRLWLGFTGNSDLLFGGDLWIPLSDHFALENSFNILFPKETGEATQREHAWSVMVQLVWYPGRCARASQSNLFRPLFGVADNTSFLVDRKPNPIH